MEGEGGEEWGVGGGGRTEVEGEGLYTLPSKYKPLCPTKIESESGRRVFRGGVAVEANRRGGVFSHLNKLSRML